MATAIIYARVSTQGQVEKELSLPAQIEQAEKKAAALGAEVVRRFVDEGISGTTDRRPAFQDAIAYAETFQPDLLITWSTSRFARDKVDAGLYKKRLERAGVKLVYVSQDIDSSSDAGWLLEGVLEIFDEMQSRSTAADTKRSMLKNARGGFWNGGRAPFGYKAAPAPADTKRKVLALDELEAPLVLEIFETRARGQGAQAIATMLNTRGTLNRGITWRKRTILDLLRNEAMIGHVVFNRKDRRNGRDRPRENWIIVESHQPIIHRDLWQAVQAMFPADAAGRYDGDARNGWAFTGLLKCGHCDTLMRIETAKGRSRRYSYYNCRTWCELRECRNLRLRADVLEDWLLSVVLDEVLTIQNLEGVVQELNVAAGKWAMDARRRRRALGAKLAQIEARNRNLYDILELQGREAPNLGDLSARLRANNAEIKAIQAELLTLDRAPAAPVPLDHDQVGAIRGFLAETVKTTQNNSRLRNFLRSFVRSVTVKDGEVRLEYDPRALVTPSLKAVVPTEGMWLPGPDSNQRPVD